MRNYSEFQMMVLGVKLFLCICLICVMIVIVIYNNSMSDSVRC